MGFLNKLKDKNFLKGASSFLGACLVNFIAGAIYSLCTLAVYEISYIKAMGGDVNIDHLSFYYPIEQFFQCVSSFLSGIIYKELGLHLTNLIGTISLLFGYLLMYLSKSLFLDLFSMVLGGIGTGIILYPATANTYNWFKDHIGIIVGIMETMISLGSFFFSLFGENIINKYEVQSDDVNNLYDYDIGKKIKDYLLIQLISLIVIFILSLILIFEKKEEETDTEIMSKIEKTDGVLAEDDKNEKANETEKKEETDDIPITYVNETNDDNLNNDGENELNKDNEEKKEEKGDENDKEKENEKEDKNIKKDENLNINEEKDKKELDNGEGGEDDDDDGKNTRPLISKKSQDEEEEVNLVSLLKFALKSPRLIIFISIVILQAPISNMAFTLYREIGEYKKIDQTYLQLVGSFYFIFEMLSSLVFGVLCDYIPIRYLLIFINGVGTMFGFVFCLTFKSGLLFLLIQNLLSFSSGGYDPIRECFLMKVYGEDVYIELNGYVSFLEAVIFNLITPLTYFIESAIGNKDAAYWILFVSFGILNLIALILSFIIKDAPIDLKSNYFDDKASRKLNISLRYFHNSFKNSFHTSFHMV